MTDDATWLAAGRRELLPAAGTYKGGLKMTLKGCAVREYLDTQHAYDVWYGKT